MDNKHCRKEYKDCEEDEFFDEGEFFDEDKFESIEEVDCCFDDNKGDFTEMMEEIYKEGYEKGCKEGYEKAVKEFLSYMKKNNCYIKCCRCHSNHNCF